LFLYSCISEDETKNENYLVNLFHNNNPTKPIMSAPSNFVASEEKGLDEEKVSDFISLVSKEGQSFLLPKAHAYLSNLVKTASEQDKVATQIDISAVKGEILTRVVAYLAHHQGVVPKEIKKPLRSVDMSKVVDDQWDATFINSLVQQDLFDLILAANYMDIQSLLNLGCAKVASCIKGKSNEEIKAIFRDGKAGYIPPECSSSSSSVVLSTSAGSAVPQMI
jgi:S-phase kinase-associated protein 1